MMDKLIFLPFPSTAVLVCTKLGLVTISLTVDDAVVQFPHPWCLHYYR